MSGHHRGRCQTIRHPRRQLIHAVTTRRITRDIHAVWINSFENNHVFNQASKQHVDMVLVPQIPSIRWSPRSRVDTFFQLVKALLISPLLVIDSFRCTTTAMHRDKQTVTCRWSLAEHANLTQPEELALIRKIADLPVEIARSAEDYAVHRLVTYSIELARAYHHFYSACRVVDAANLETTRSRLALCEATKIALQQVLKLLGVSAPERM